MTPLKLIAASAVAASLVSCANNSQNDYNPPNPYGTPDYGVADGASYQPVNPVYDTPAAYEESSVPNPADSYLPHVPSTPSAPASGGGGTVHTIVKGDTLWGLSRQYNVSIEAIQRANSMTKDTVVLGQKLTIPAP